MYSNTNLKQFLARISNYKISGLSEHNQHEHHVKLKVPNQEDAMIHIEIGINPRLKDGHIGFR